MDAILEAHAFCGLADYCPRPTVVRGFSSSSAVLSFAARACIECVLRSRGIGLAAEVSAEARRYATRGRTPVKGSRSFRSLAGATAIFPESCGIICAGRARVVIKLALRVRAIRT